MKFLLSVFTLFFFSETSLGSRIIFLFPVMSKSHLIVVHGLSTTLAAKGHDVTVVSPFPLAEPAENHREIKSPLTQEAQDIINEMVKNPNPSMMKQMPLLTRVTFDLGRKMLEMHEMKQIMNEEKFDLVVIGMFLNEFLLGFGEHFNCPTMILSTSGGTVKLNFITGNPIGVSAVPHLAAYQSTPMNFCQRVKHFLIYVVDFGLQCVTDYYQKKIYELVFKWP